MRARPDEGVYHAQAQAVRDRGVVQGLRVNVSRYMADRAAHHFPSPLRWLWILLRAVTGRAPSAVTVASAIACLPLAWWVTSRWQAVVLVGASPLLAICARTKLQDATVAALTMAAIGCAVHGHAIGLAGFVFALVAVKESSALTLPAIASVWAWHWGANASLFGALLCATVAYGATTWALLGSRSLAILQRLRAGHETDYTREHQRGGIRRLIADVAMLSPLPLLAIAPGASHAVPLAFASVVIMLTHGCSPVQNARTILAADLLIRCVAAYAIGSPLLLALFVALDVATTLATRKVYDPVTAEIQQALGFRT